MLRIPLGALLGSFPMNQPSRMPLAFLVTIAFASLAIAGGSALSFAREIRPGVRARPGAAPGTVQLPYNASDSAGNQWFINAGGWLQQRGNQPIYSQGAVLQVNSNGVQSSTNQARLDDKTGEVVLENMT